MPVHAFARGAPRHLISCDRILALYYNSCRFVQKHSSYNDMIKLLRSAGIVPSTKIVKATGRDQEHGDKSSPAKAAAQKALLSALAIRTSARQAPQPPSERAESRPSAAAGVRAVRSAARKPAPAKLPAKTGGLLLERGSPSQAASASPAAGSRSPPMAAAAAVASPRNGGAPPQEVGLAASQSGPEQIGAAARLPEPAGARHVTAKEEREMVDAERERLLAPLRRLPLDEERRLLEEERARLLAPLEAATGLARRAAPVPGPAGEHAAAAKDAASIAEGTHEAATAAGGVPGAKKSGLTKLRDRDAREALMSYFDGLIARKVAVDTRRT